MNKNIFTCIVAICCLMLFQSATISTETEMNKPQEKIKLREGTPKTRPYTATEVEAYTDGKILTVEVTDYDGDVQVQVFGAGNSRQGYFECHQAGYGELNIESLPGGAYTVIIVLNSNTYSGTFVK